MRLLFFGDLAATGFGSVTRDLGRAFLAAGVDVRFVSWNEDGNELEEPFKSRTLVLGGANGWLGPTPSFTTSQAADIWAKMQRDRIRGLFHDIDGWKPDVGLVTTDPAGFISSGLVSFVDGVEDLIPEDFPMFHYCPIEGIGSPPSWRAIWRHVTPIAMSEFGANEIERLLGTRPAVVYHGVSDDFYPASVKRPIMLDKKREWLRSKADAKRHLGIDPRAIVLYRADRFVPRKQFGPMLRAAAAVMAKHPDVLLLLHCRTVDEGGNLVDFISHLHPSIGSRIRSTGIADAGHVADRKLLNIMYNAADVYLSSGAEGFGLTIAESLAAGTPALGLDFSAVPEVIGDAGMVVPVGQLIENQYACWWAAPDELQYAAALETMVTDIARRGVMAARAPYQASKFSWATAAAQILGVMQPAAELEAVAA